MRLRVGGTWAFAERVTPGMKRPGSWLPRREAKYWYAVGGRYLCVVWQPRKGLFPLGLSHLVGGVLRDLYSYPDLRGRRVKRIGGSGGPDTGAVALSAESVTLKKYPRLCEFLTAVAYDDGGPRQPGRMWIENDGLSFVVSLYELSAFLRVRLRATSLDDAFVLAETHLKAENAPWEVDSWAKDRAQQKKKR